MENIPNTQRKANPIYLVKHRKKVVADFSKIKHKSVLRKIIGGSAVSMYFNFGIVSEKNQLKINKYFNEL